MQKNEMIAWLTICIFSLLLAFTSYPGIAANADLVRVFLLYRHRPGSVEISAQKGDYALRGARYPAAVLRSGERWTVKCAGKGLHITAASSSLSRSVVGTDLDHVRLLRKAPQSRLRIRCLAGESGESPEAVSRGNLTISVAGRRLFLLEEIMLEEYLSGVLPEEIPAQFPKEALKAQCVASRTFALKGRGRHRKEGADFCDNSHCQVYGKGEEWQALEEARRDTEGFVLTYKGNLARVFYHSSCGGRTANIDFLWNARGDLKYLSGVADHTNGRSFCRTSPYFRWTRDISENEMKRLMSWKGEMIEIQVIPGDFREPKYGVILRGNQGNRQMTLYEFWTTLVDSLGWGSLGSPWFQVKKRGNKFCFTGRGLGHGVGLCQWGAKGMAESGYLAKEILSHYFPGTCVEKRYHLLNPMPLK